MSNDYTLKAAMDEENRRKDRALMSDTYNFACSRNPPSTPYAEPDHALREGLNAQLAKAGLPVPPTYERPADNGQRLRRTDQVSANVNKSPHSHYFKDVSKLDEIDVYRVCELFNVTDPSGATQHAIKKLLMSGQRGVKDARRDLQEAADTLKRRLQMLEVN